MVEPNPPERKRRRPRAEAPAAVETPPAPAPALIDTAPLSAFGLSPLNARRHYDDADIDELAADLERRGQLQNLVAVVADDGNVADLLVIAGGRRLRALWRLKGAGKIPADRPVTFQLAAAEDGRSTSLAENTQKVVLNPVDEIAAYQAIVEEHADRPDPILYAATRQGVPRAHVERMLRLADLHPDVLDALGSGRLDLPAACAYATTGDQAAQALVFATEERREHGARHRPDNVRDSLRGRAYPAAIPQARYVGLDAYQAAGGRVGRDFFLLGEDGGELLLDPTLLDGLVREKAARDMATRVERDGLASGLLTKSFTALPQWPTVPPGYRIGGRVADATTMSTLPAFDVRPTAIGIYTLQGSLVAPIGWLEPTAPAVSPAAPEPMRPADAEPASQLPRPPAMLTRTLTSSPELTMAELEERATRRRAAALAARAMPAALLLDRIVQPEPGDDPDALVEVLPDGDVLVTVQVRVHPDELEAQRATAAAELEATSGGGRGCLGSGE